MLENTNKEQKAKPTFTVRFFVIGFVGLMLLICSVIVGLDMAESTQRAKDTQCRSNIKSIGTELLNFSDYYGCLPPPYISSKDGKALFSWRVLTLPSYSLTEIYDRFDFAKPWDDPANMSLCGGTRGVFLTNLFSCPAGNLGVPHRADYFLTVDAQFHWPIDYFVSPKSSPCILLVEAGDRGCYWSKPIDLEYQKPGIQGLLQSTKTSKPVHKGGFNCFVSNGSVKRLPVPTDADGDAELEFGVRLPRKLSQIEEELEIEGLVARLTQILATGAYYNKHHALLLLGELGPRATLARSSIRKVIGEGNVQLTRLAEFVLAKIDK
jgi:Protein of unknown function (DUF1559)